ncbi:MAG TPA: hypothetical protein DG577_00075 [Firmicutes bacterium]|jgi:hypothetical protein|nr:hypothetical protein [Bacillota bacterium]
MRTAIKYQLTEVKKPLLIYYSIICLIISMNIFITFYVNNIGVNAIEASSMIFIFVVGLNSFKETFRMFLQNSRSRKTQFTSFMLSILPISALMALIDTTIGSSAHSLSSYQSLFRQLYALRYLGNSSDLQVNVEGFLWSMLVYAAFAMVGYFITTLYYRMNKGQKLFVSIGVPVFLLILLPIVDETFTNGKMFPKVVDFFLLMSGVKNGYNPFYAMASSALFFLLFGGLSYCLAKRAVIKE